MRSTLLSLTLLFLVLFPVLVDGGPRPEPVEAGTAVRLSLEELAAEAELILEGRVLFAAAERKGSHIVTHVLLDLDRTLAGAERRFRWITLPGGVLPSGEGLILAGVPRLVTGEEVVLFLSASNELGVRMPVGLAQGKWSVLRSLDGRRFVQQSHFAREVLMHGSVERRAMAYPDFLARVTAGRRHAKR